MNKVKYLLITSLLVSTAVTAGGPSSLSPVNGNYNGYSKAEYDNDQYFLWANAVYAGVEYSPTYNSFVCTKHTLALEDRVPGKLVNGYCYYPNHGDEVRQSEYFVLNQSYNGQYKWKGATSIEGFTHAVSARGFDAGALMYHCRYRSSNGSVYPGKYLPNKGACYYAFHGDEKKITDASTFDILVPNYYPYNIFPY